MITTANLTEAFARNVAIIRRQAAGLTQEESLRQPPFRGNCLNWVVGHLADYRDHILRALGAEPVMGEAGERLFFWYFHETYHVGQTELLRQLAGKDDKII